MEVISGYLYDWDMEMEMMTGDSYSKTNVTNAP